MSKGVRHTKLRYEFGNGGFRKTTYEFVAKVFRAFERNKHTNRDTRSRGCGTTVAVNNYCMFCSSQKVTACKAASKFPIFCTMRYLPCRSLLVQSYDANSWYLWSNTLLLALLLLTTERYFGHYGGDDKLQECQHTSMHIYAVIHEWLPRPWFAGMHVWKPVLSSCILPNFWAKELHFIIFAFALIGCALMTLLLSLRRFSPWTSIASFWV